MSEFITTLLIVMGIFIISFLLLNIRHIITGKEFRGTCATNNPMLKNKAGECNVCGKTAEEECKLAENETS